MFELRGCGTALVTPFKADGSIDERAFRSLVQWQIESAIDFLVPCGTTGETPTLSHDEWLRVIDLAIEVAAGRVPIVAGATSNSTREAVQKAAQAGYATTDQELEIGLRSIAVPVVSPRGGIVGAMSASASSARISMREMIRGFVPVLKASAEGLGRAL